MNERPRRLLARFSAGPAWTDRRAPQDQPGWDEHAAFVDELVARGTMRMGGPLSDHSGALMLLEGVDEREARELLARDPFVENGVFVLEEILAWTIFVDDLART